MNNNRHGRLSTALLIILLMVFAGQASAEPTTRQVSYSPDYWPSRWSSAIRLQQTAGFPTRVEEKVTLEELPETVLEQDLFFSPSTRSRLDTDRRPYNHGQRESKHRFSRNSGRSNRDAAFAYQSRYGAVRANYAGSAYGPVYSHPAAVPIPAMGILPGIPGGGFPMMPGIPGAYPMNIVPYGGMPYGGMPYGGIPYGGVPYGYPGNMAMWTPPFGPW